MLNDPTKEHSFCKLKLKSSMKACGACQVYINVIMVLHGDPGKNPRMDHLYI